MKEKRIVVRMEEPEPLEFQRIVVHMEEPEPPKPIRITVQEEKPKPQKRRTRRIKLSSAPKPSGAT